MKKKQSIRIIILVLIIVLAGFFMFKGANVEGRKYNIEQVKEFNYFLLNEDNKYGVIDKSANKIIDPKYESVTIPNPSKAIFVCVEENGKTHVFDDKNKELFTEYEEITSIRLKNITGSLMYEKSVLKYKKDGKYGLIDFDGNEVTKPIYGQIDALGYKEGELIVEKDGKFGVINIKGIELVPAEYETIKIDNYYTEENKYKDAGYIVGVKTEQGYRYGYIDVNGNKVLDNEFNELSRVDIKADNDFYFIGSKSGRFGIYKNKDQILNNDYQYIEFNKSNNIFIIEKAKRYGVCDINGSIIIDTKYIQIDSNGKYLYAKESDDKTVVYDTQGKEVNISADITKQIVANGKYIIVINNEKNKSMYGINDSNDNQVVETKYSYLDYLYDNLFIACNEQGQLGIIDDKGNIKLEINNTLVQKYKNTDLLLVNGETETNVQLYNRNMDKICDLNEARIEDIDDYIIVYNNNEKVFINQNGNKVSNKEILKDNKLFAIAKDGKWGFENKNGEIKVQCIYDGATEFNKYGYAGILKDGKWGIINDNGDILVEPKYEIKSSKQPEFLGNYYKVEYGFGEFYYTNK